MDRFPLHSAADVAANHARYMALHVWGDEQSGRACDNCGTTEGSIEQVWTDDGRKPRCAKTAPSRFAARKSSQMSLPPYHPATCASRSSILPRARANW